MRSYLPLVAGNEALRARLGQELASGAFSHAYILEGPRGCGKRTLAREMAMAAACLRRDDEIAPLPCGRCEACRKIREGLSPDVMRVRREEDKATLGVDVVRAVRDGLAVVPNDLDLKIYIVEDAHTMTPQAQNAFLLSLEEPPPFVLFLLLTEDAGALLETVRSRAQTLRLRPLSEGQIADWLLSPTAEATVRTAAEALRRRDPAAFDVVLKMADGRIGKAVELLDEARRAPVVAARQTAEAFCRLLASRASGEAWIAPIGEMGTKREEVTATLLFFELALRDLIALSREETAPLLFFTEREPALSLVARLPVARLFAAFAATEATIKVLVENANVRLALADLHGRLAP